MASICRDRLGIASNDQLLPNQFVKYLTRVNLFVVLVTAEKGESGSGASMTGKSLNS